MVTKEIWTCLLAYNLIRQRILQAALLAERSPRQISFTAALQKIAASWSTILMCGEECARTMIEVHLRDLAQHIVDRSPRPKPHRLLNQPRAQAKAQLTNGAAAA
ncbi:MAG: hypothetical protein HYX68_19810 [Planctomycetes bacterium]|nr:hypothetical protein [Planctomycetota bacterium]